MVAYNFSSEFAELVAIGAKRQTIRAHRKRHVRPGESVQLYTGMRTRNCRKLREVDPVCLSVERIELWNRGGGLYVYIIDNEGITHVDADIMAMADGFDDAAHMFAWFDDRHGLPFQGVLIRWKP